MWAWDVAKPLVDEAIDQDPHLPPRGFHAFLPAALPLSSQTLSYVTRVIRRNADRAGDIWRPQVVLGQAAAETPGRSLIEISARKLATSARCIALTALPMLSRMVRMLVSLMVELMTIALSWHS